MSTLKVSAIQSPSTTDGGLAISSTGAVSGGLPVPNRNLLYNGAMQVAQRGTSATGITNGSSGYHTADRWRLTETGTLTSVWTQSIESDAPSGSGFRKSLKMLASTGEASPAADVSVSIYQRLEGQDVQRIAKGTASAQQLTLSFWVKSNATGTYVVRLYDEDNDRSVSASYDVSASATWESKSVTFPADATGAFDNDNNQSLRAEFWLVAGSNRSSGTLNTAWESTVTANIAAGQTNVAAAVNNYWQITGVQLEVGPVATDFEFKSYGTELAECQRYYETGNSVYGYLQTSAMAGYIMDPLPFKTTKRATPTMSASFASNSGTQASTSITFPTQSYRLNSDGATGYLNYTSGVFLLDYQWIASSEL